ncbi:hypothetical protein C8R44DRAFT_761156 [Mycena epipterygia]|nr:hypothetical protein C8R44DRAFT_761156 [Mycena epipterygia]
MPPRKVDPKSKSSANTNHLPATQDDGPRRWSARQGSSKGASSDPPAPTTQPPASQSSQSSHEAQGYAPLGLFNPQLRSITSVKDQHLDSSALNTGGRAPIARMTSPPRPVANLGPAQTPVRPLPSQHMPHPQQTPAQRAARRLESQITGYGPMASPGPRRRDWNDNTSDEDENDIRSEQSVEGNDSEPEEPSRPPAVRCRISVPFRVLLSPKVTNILLGQCCGSKF